MNFLESVGSLTIIFGALYLYFNNKDKQARKGRSSQLHGSKQEPLYPSREIQNIEIASSLPIDNSSKDTSSDDANRIEWLEILEDKNIPAEFRKVVHGYLLPYQINTLKFTVNTQAMKDSSAYIMYEDDKNFSKTLLNFLINPGLRASGYPSWFYAAFPDVAMWAINGEGNKIFQSKYSHYTEAELLDPESSNRFSDKILTSLIDLYTSSGKRLECRS